MKKNLLIGLILFFIAGTIAGIQISEFLQPEKEEVEKIELNNVIENQMKIVAVDNNMQGVTADLITEIRPGSGLVLVNINDILADYYTQYSARTAAKVAGNYTNINLEDLDISYNIIAENATLIAGPSAGSAMAVAAIAALENKTLNENIMMTGTINEDGSFGEAGAIVEKAKAAKQNNATIFLVPSGFGTEITEYNEEKSCGTYNENEYCEIKIKSKRTSLGKDIGIEIKEVKNVEEALKYFYKENEN